MGVTKTPLTFLTSVTVVDPGTQWVTRNTLHVKGEVFSGIVSGDLTGTSMTVVDTELNVNNPAVSFTGIQIRAKFTLTTATVTWAGTITDSGPLGLGTTHVEARGTDGSILSGALFGLPDGTFLFQGMLMTP